MSDFDLGKKLQKRREELGLTLEDVGKKVGVGRSTVQRWESGLIKNMRSDKIRKLAEALQMDPVELVPGPVEYKTLHVETAQQKSAFDILMEAAKTGERIQIVGLNPQIRVPVSAEIDKRFKSMMKLWEVSTPSTQDTVIEFMKAANKTNKKE